MGFRLLILGSGTPGNPEAHTFYEGWPEKLKL